MAHVEIDLLTEEAWKKRLLDLQAAYRSGIELIALSESRNYTKGIADSSKILGYCFWRFSDYSLSLSHSLKALRLYENLGDKKGVGDTLNNIGAVYMFQNDNAKRLEVNLKCKAIREEIGDLEGVASSEGNIGETYFEMGDYVNALKCFNAVLENRHASPQGIAWAYHNIGRVENAIGDWDKAYTYYKKGLEVSQSVDYQVLITDSFLKITELFVDLKKYEQAIGYAEQALDVSRAIGAKEGEKKALYFLSKIYEAKNLFQESLKYHKDFHTIDIEISRDTEIERLKTLQLKVAYDKIEEQKNELIDSIKYAERIQKAVLTRDQNQSLLLNYFVWFQPKDIVSGDFHWYHEKDDHFYLCVADCTGHGVPGAFLTMLGTTYLTEIITGDEQISPAHILDDLRNRIIKALSQSSDRVRQDGMDISLIRVNTSTFEAEWAGAYNPLWIVRNNDLPVLKTHSDLGVVGSENHHLFELKGDRQPVSISDKMHPFTNHEIQLEKGDRLYLFSDGFAHQFGGERSKKFMTPNFQKKILSIQNLDMCEQGKELEQEFKKWKGQLEQLDDICILGFEL